MEYLFVTSIWKFLKSLEYSSLAISEARKLDDNRLLATQLMNRAGIAAWLTITVRLFQSDRSMDIGKRPG